MTTRTKKKGEFVRTLKLNLINKGMNEIKKNKFKRIDDAIRMVRNISNVYNP